MVTETRHGHLHTVREPIESGKRRRSRPEQTPHKDGGALAFKQFYGCRHEQRICKKKEDFKSSPCNTNGSAKLKQYFLIIAYVKLDKQTQVENGNCNGKYLVSRKCFKGCI